MVESDGDGLAFASYLLIFESQEQDLLHHGQLGLFAALGALADISGVESDFVAIFAILVARLWAAVSDVVGGIGPRGSVAGFGFSVGYAASASATTPCQAGRGHCNDVRIRSRSRSTERARISAAPGKCAARGEVELLRPAKRVTRLSRVAGAENGVRRMYVRKGGGSQRRRGTMPVAPEVDVVWRRMRSLAMEHNYWHLRGKGTRARLEGTRAQDEAAVLVVQKGDSWTGDDLTQLRGRVIHSEPNSRDGS